MFILKRPNRNLISRTWNVEHLWPYYTREIQTHTTWRNQDARAWRFKSDEQKLALLMNQNIIMKVIFTVYTPSMNATFTGHAPSYKNNIYGLYALYESNSYELFSLLESWKLNLQGLSYHTGHSLVHRAWNTICGAIDSFKNYGLPHHTRHTCI